jgi:hypothetical protein
MFILRPFLQAPLEAVFGVFDGEAKGCEFVADFV